MTEMDLEIAATNMVDQIAAEVVSEFKRAVAKHGVIRTPANPAMPSYVKLPILAEEIGEAAELCLCRKFLVKLGAISRAMTYDEGDTEKLEAEMIQVAAMAVASIAGLRLAKHIEASGESV